MESVEIGAYPGTHGLLTHTRFSAGGLVQKQLSDRTECWSHMEINFAISSYPRTHTSPTDRAHKDWNDLNGCEFKSRAFPRSALPSPLIHFFLYRLDYDSPASHFELKASAKWLNVTTVCGYEFYKLKGSQGSKEIGRQSDIEVVLRTNAMFDYYWSNY